MAKATKKKRDTIADEMLAGLQSFACDLKKLPEQNAKAKYRHRTVEVRWAPSEYDAEAVKQLRSSMQCSQRVFADFIGVSPGTLRNWEQGVRPVSGVASRLLDEMRINPGYWRIRLQQSVTPRQAG